MGEINNCAGVVEVEKKLMANILKITNNELSILINNVNLKLLYLTAIIP